MANRKMLAVVGFTAGIATVAAVAAAARGAGAAELGPPLTLVEGGASNPTAALAADGGAAYVAWVETKAGASDVLVARVAGDARAAPVRANDVAGDAAPHEQAPAQVAVGPEGNVYVLWQNNRVIPGRRFPASDLRFARSEDGGKTFMPAVTVNDDAGGPPSSHTFHDVVVAPDGTVWVSWIDSRARDAERARRTPTPAAEAPKPGATAGASGHGGHGAMKEDPTLPESEIRVAKSTDGGKTFGPSTVVDGGVCPCCRTSLAVGPDGSVFVGWRKHYGGDVRDVVVARLAPGAAAFGAPVRVHQDGWVFPGCPHAGPSVAVDARGRVHVGWYTGKEERQGLWYAVSEDGGRSYGAPVALLTGGFVPPSQVALAADGDGVLASWDDRRAAAGPLTLARVENRRVRVLSADAAGRTPAVDARGSARVIAWHDGEAVRARIASRR